MNVGFCFKKKSDKFRALEDLAAHNAWMSIAATMKPVWRNFYRKRFSDLTLFLIVCICVSVH